MVPIRRCSVKHGRGLIVLALTVLTAHAEVPTPEAVSVMRSKLAAMRKVLTEHHGELPEQQEQVLLTRLGDTERAFESYVRLVARGKAREEAKAPLYAAGGALIADDLSGAGAADDVLLPFVAAAVIMAHVKTLPPPSEQELAVAWAGFLASLQALAKATVDVAAQRKPGCYCYCHKQGVGRYEHKRVSTPSECKQFCDSIEYPGHQCGGSVIWKKGLN